MQTHSGVLRCIAHGFARWGVSRRFHHCGASGGPKRLCRDHLLQAALGICRDRSRASCHLLPRMRPKLCLRLHRQHRLGKSGSMLALSRPIRLMRLRVLRKSLHSHSVEGTVSTQRYEIHGRTKAYVGVHNMIHSLAGAGYISSHPHT